MKTLFLLFFVIVSNCAFCQIDSSSSPLKKVETISSLTSFSNIVNKEFSIEYQKEKPSVSCVISAIFTSFQIDSSGIVTNIKFSDVTNLTDIQKIITKTLYKTNNLCTSALLKDTVKNKTLILPLIIQLEANCANRVIPNSTDNAILTFLMDKTQNSYFNCIILKPLMIFSTN